MYIDLTEPWLDLGVSSFTFMDFNNEHVLLFTNMRHSYTIDKLLLQQILKLVAVTLFTGAVAKILLVH